MANKKIEKARTPQGLCDYLEGQRDGLRRTIKALEKDLAKVEGEIQAAAFAAGKEQTSASRA